MPPITARPALAAVALALSFVFMGVWARMMADGFGTFQQVYLRLLLAGLLAVAVFRRSLNPRELGRLTPREWAGYGVRALLSYTVGVGLFTAAVLDAKLSTVSFVASLPVLGVMAWLLFGEKVRATAIPFIAFSVVGLVLMTSVRLDDLTLGRGEVAAIVSMVGFNLGYLLARLHPPRMSNYQNTTLLLLLGWIPLFALSLLAGEPLVPSHVSARAWFGLAISSVLNIVGLVLINYVFTSLKAYVAGNLLLLEGIFAALVGFLLYGETIGGRELAGAAVLLGCAYAVSTVEGRGARRESAALAD